MKKRKIILLIAGAILLAAALGLAVFSGISQQTAAKEAAQRVSTLRQLMPEIENAVMDGRENAAMPAMEIDRKNLCGILEIPAYNRELPIRSGWDKKEISQQPCRFTGSVYDGSLIIGGSANPGQLDFIRDITGGHSVYIADTTGSRFRFTVFDAYRTKDVSAQKLMALEADLVLFAKNTYSLDYTLILCKAE